MNDYDFEDMRQQMSILKEKLQKQEIVNDRLIRRSMRKNVANINRTYIALCALALLMIPYSYWAFVSLSGFSVAFWIGTCVLLLSAFGYTLWNGQSLRDGSLMRDDLLVARQKVALAKKRDSQWLFFGIPVCILWIAWFAFEVYKKGGEEEVTTFLLAGTIGGIVGLILGLTIHFRTQRQYQEIINQIEDVTQTEQR